MEINFNENMNRRTGRTTRAVDGAIQDLFNTGKCVVWDHYENGKNNKANQMVLNKTLARLQNEHPLIMREISVDIAECSIEINRGTYE